MCTQSLLSSASLMILNWSSRSSICVFCLAFSSRSRSSVNTCLMFGHRFAHLSQELRRDPRLSASSSRRYCSMIISVGFEAALGFDRAQLFDLVKNAVKRLGQLDDRRVVIGVADFLRIFSRMQLIFVLIRP